MLGQHLLEIPPRVTGGVLGRSMTTVTHKPTFRTPDEVLEEALNHLYRHLKQQKVL